MYAGSLESLPKELIALIASFAKPSTLLKLSVTCRSIRAACWDSLILKNILLASQHENWGNESLDIEAIASTAGNDVTTWARYCIADESAKALLDSVPNDPSRFHTEMTHPLKLPKTYISYLPELFVVKHPLMRQQFWEATVLCRRDANPRQIFCLAMTILASENDMVKVLQSLYHGRLNWFLGIGDTSTFLLALCTIALWARNKIKQRLAAWPYNDAAMVPYIQLPKAFQIPLEPLNEGYDVPAPFSRRPAELLGKLTSSFSAWDSWYRLHSFSALQYLTDGKWCGYSIHFGMQNFQDGISPPMMNIKFEIQDASSNSVPVSNDSQILHFSAEDCIDGLDFFNLAAQVTYRSNDVIITARKTYQNRLGGWDWDCRLTPFGIVGFWGERMNSIGNTDRLIRHGIIWLWKESWTEGS